MPDILCTDAIEILQRTRDGEDLAPQHLKLVELAVNGCLNDAGTAAFYDLLRHVREGYAKPWFHGVEHMTRDHEGYVLWKGRPVEHFSAGYAHGDEAKAYVAELANRCTAIEARGEVPSTGNAVWSWPD